MKIVGGAMIGFVFGFIVQGFVRVFVGQPTGYSVDIDSVHGCRGDSPESFLGQASEAPR